MATIAKLLIDLASDPDLLRRYNDDAVGVMADYGLSERQRALLELGDLELIREAVDYEYMTGAAPELPEAGADEPRAMLVTWRPKFPPTWPPTWAPTWTPSAPGSEQAE